MRTRSPATTLGAGGAAAILASACCVGPLVLVSIGLGGAWLSRLRLLEPYQPIFIVIALAALFLAYRRIFRPACEPGDACAAPPYQRVYKLGFWLIAVLVLAVLVFPYLAPLFY